MTDLRRTKTKVVCTLGPATNSKEAVRELILAGMDVARLNFSHGAHEEHLESIRRIREIADELDQRIAILQDLSGPKIRTGALATKTAELTAGEPFTLTARPTPGNEREVGVNYKELVSEVDAGDQILMADGALELRVDRVTETDIVCEVIVGGELGEHKGVNVPTKTLRLPSMTDKDRDDLLFGLAHGVDWIALSFVRTPEDLDAVKNLIREAGKETPVVAKIEKRAAIHNLDAILDRADGVMVARGDLGVEIPMYEIPWVQKQIILKANHRGIPVVTATQMLESMIENPRPTRAELTDIANAILDGTDAVMLSGETAVGKHPFGAVRIMQQIANTATERFEYAALMAERHIDTSADVKDAVSQAACELATVIGADLIVCCTRSGQTARAVARFRPEMPIIGVSSSDTVLRQLQLSWGVVPVSIPEPRDTDDIIDKAKTAICEARIGSRGDSIVVVAGAPLDATGTTNMIKADFL